MTTKSCGGCQYFIKVSLQTIDKLRIGFCDKYGYKTTTDSKCELHSPIHEVRKKRHSKEYIKSIDISEYDNE